jgi:hypothetical protein
MQGAHDVWGAADARGVLRPAVGGGRGHATSSLPPRGRLPPTPANTCGRWPPRKVYNGRVHALRFAQSAVEFARPPGLSVGPNDSWPLLGSGVCFLPLGPREARPAARPEGG